MLLDSVRIELSSTDFARHKILVHILISISRHCPICIWFFASPWNLWSFTPHSPSKCGVYWGSFWRLCGRSSSGFSFKGFCSYWLISSTWLVVSFWGGFLRRGLGIHSWWFWSWYWLYFIFISSWVFLLVSLSHFSRIGLICLRLIVLRFPSETWLEHFSIVPIIRFKFLRRIRSRTWRFWGVLSFKQLKALSSLAQIFIIVIILYFRELSWFLIIFICINSSGSSWQFLAVPRPKRVRVCLKLIHLTDLFRRVFLASHCTRSVVWAPSKPVAGRPIRSSRVAANWLPSPRILLSCRISSCKAYMR